MVKRGLVFRPGNHSYVLDGKPVPGVTGIISKGLPKPALMYWSAKTVAEFVADNRSDVERFWEMGRGPMVAALKEMPWQKRDTAAVRGTDVHDLAEKLIHGEQVDVPEHLSGYVAVCVDFLDDWGLTPQITESPVASRKWNYAGTFDFIGKVKDGRTLIGDWKTSASGIWPETCLQLAAYRYAEFYVDADGKEQPMPQVDGAIGVHLREDGYSVYEMRADEEIHKAFLHIAFVARTAGEMKRGWKSDELNPPTAKDENGSAA